MKFKRNFSNRLRIGYLLLLLVIVTLVWLGVGAFNWYRQGITGIVSTDSVVREYRTISRLVLLETESLNRRMSRTDQPQPNRDWEARLRAIEESLTRLGNIYPFQQEPVNSRQGEAGEGGTAFTDESLRTYAGVKQAAEDFVQAVTQINLALDEGRTDDAVTEWTRLANAELQPRLIQLINMATDLKLNRIQVDRTRIFGLTEYMISLVPLLLPLFVLFSFLLMWHFSRDHSRAINELQEAAGALADGEYDQHPATMKYEEFDNLRQSLNSMAKKLSDYRRTARDAADRLEKTVDERTQELQVSNQKLARADGERRKLMADISHEFRTPLTVIRGESELALRGSTKSSNEYQAAIRKILDQANLATRVVDDLLFIARADAGEMRLVEAAVPIVPLVNSVCEQFEATASQKGITIERHTRGVESRVHGDAGRIRQVIAILIDNALRYSRPGGTIEVSVWVTDEQIKFSVRDFGIGLAEEDVEHAFDRFYRGAEAEEHAKGTGLGLPVAKAIVEAHNGSISLEGTQGKGAIATVTLPTRSQYRGVA